MQMYAGIDLHSSNSYVGIIDEQDKRLFGKRLDNHLPTLLSVFEPFKADLAGIVVESTYNWYWLVDGLQDHGYRVHLANPSAIKQYEGLKYTDDKWDSFWLAHMKRLNILPEGYIYPKETRPVRDLLRRRVLFVRQRTSQILSLQSMITRNLGIRMAAAGNRYWGWLKTIRLDWNLLQPVNKEVIGFYILIRLCREPVWGWLKTIRFEISN